MGTKILECDIKNSHFRNKIIYSTILKNYTSVALWMLNGGRYEPKNLKID